MGKAESQNKLPLIFNTHTLKNISPLSFYEVFMGKKGMKLQAKSHFQIKSSNLNYSNCVEN